MSSDPARDKINLSRVLAKIETNNVDIPPHIRAQNLQYAKILAKRIYGDTNPYESQLDRLETCLNTSSITSSNRRKAPSTRSYTSLLEPIVSPSETIPVSPSNPSVAATSSNDQETDLVEQMLIPTEEIASTITSLLVSVPAPPAPPIDLSILLAPTPDPPSTPTLQRTISQTKSQASEPKLNTESTSAFLTTARQTQEEISARMAEMATQLKKNAQFFGKALEDDKEAMEQADAALEKNMDMMQKERNRLGTYSGKSRSTTWLVFLSVAVVGVSWVLMFFLIRITNIV